MYQNKTRQVTESHFRASTHFMKWKLHFNEDKFL